MLKLETPLLLSPVFKPKIWGRKELSPLFGGRAGADEGARNRPGRDRIPRAADTPIGEAWITDATSRIMNGPAAGLTLGEVSVECGSELHGSNWPNQAFPLLAKYIFTNDWLSVQVHPDDETAAQLDPGEAGKCEMWYIVSAGRGAEFLLGLKHGATIESLRTACERGTSKELLKHFRPRAGEAVHIPPGTVHALGPGLVLFEAEQNSDLTYRLDDFGRLGLDGNPRPLHLAKGIKAAWADLAPRRNLPRLEFRERFGSRRYVVACRHFAVEELTLKKLASLESVRARVEILSILGGDGRVETAEGWMGYFPGDTLLIPPGAGPYRLAPRRTTRILKCYVPDLDKDFRSPLVRKRVKAAEIAKVVFD